MGYQLVCTLIVCERNDPVSECNNIAARCGVINGQWNEWSAWSSCTNSCAGGSRSRARTSDNPAPAKGGAACEGDSDATEACNEHACPVHGEWGVWSEFDTCTKSCGGGQQERTRVCDSPAPLHGGDQCPGDDRNTVACNQHTCAVDGVWGNWGSLSDCSLTCGGGVQHRYRYCDSPSPQYGGNNCPGGDSESTSCNVSPCPINGNWGSWGAYTTCDRVCGGMGRKYRFRQCDNPAPDHGGADCGSAFSETSPCETYPCRDDARIIPESSSNPHRGRLEVKEGSQWGTVCDDNFIDNQNAAKVFCRSMGYVGGTF